MKEIIVIGCGPAGMMAAIAASDGGAKVTILDHMKSGGKKLLLTGNGRCNLTNMDPLIRERYYSSTPDQLRRVIEAAYDVMDAAGVCAFFEDAGMPVMVSEGLVYPRSEQSEAVLYALMRSLESRKVKMKYNINILGIRKDEASGRFSVNTEGWTYEADCVILACGSRSYEQTGSDGSGYDLAASFGHKIEKVLPSLTALLSDEKDLAGCFGARTRSQVRLFIDEKYISCQEGQIQWLRNGVSGIPVFQLSGNASAALARGSSVKLAIDFVPETEKSMLIQKLEHIRMMDPNQTLNEQNLSGYLPSQILPCILGRVIKDPKKRKKWSPEVTIRLADIMKCFEISINRVRDFDQAQVCRGGVSLQDIIPHSLMSGITKGLYFAGEILDVDGPCGGYNLQWAWASGYLAGFSAAKT